MKRHGIPAHLGLIVFVLLGGMSTRAAEPQALSSATKAETDKRAKSRQQFELAEEQYKLGRFVEALDAYSRAYELFALPGFLFNIGQCHRQLGDCEKALFFFEGYLRDKPDADNRQAVELLMEECRKNLGAARLQKQERKAEEQLRLQQESLRLAEQQRLEQERMLALQRELDEKRPEREMMTQTAFYETWWFWTLVGGVVAAAAGTTAYALTRPDEHVPASGSLGTLDLRGL